MNDKINLKLLNDIKLNQELSNFIHENNLEDKDILNNLNLFLKVKESLDKCLNCKGLYMCNQKRMGEKESLEYDGILIKSVEYCSYYLKKKEENNFINSFIYTDIPEILVNLNFDDIELDNEDTKKLFVELNNILDGIRNKGLYIYGDLGVGKTYLSTALANELVKNKRKVSFVKVSSFINEMRRLVSTDTYRFDKLINDLSKSEYLFLDDIGSESVSSFSRDDVLYPIIEYRNDNNLLTIFTSNLSKNDLLKHYTYDKNDKASSMHAKRFLDRIDILTDDFCLKGENKRRKEYVK